MAVMSSTNRLGLRSVVDDHVQTWSLRGGSDRKRDLVAAVGWYYGGPTLLGSVFYFAHVKLLGVGQLLAGVSVFSGLLFGMLILIFNTGLSLRKDAAAFASAHDVRRTIADLRANVTYTVIVAISLALLLVVAAASNNPAKGLPWGWTPFIAGLFLHLGLNLLTILARVRTAFNVLTR
jgi:hypothetical protein